MKVRQVEVSDADKRSAQIFFGAVREFYDLSQATALDMFARTGVLTVDNYCEHVQGLHLWELGPEHEEALRAFDPAEVVIGCSYRTAQLTPHKFDFVVVDSPQGAHHDYSGQVHYEHFDILRWYLPRLLKDESVVVLYVNKRPYNKDILGEHGYDLYEEYNYTDWLAARLEFYGSCEVTEEQAVGAYRRALAKAGFGVTGVLITPCYSDVPSYAPYAFRLALKVSRA